MTRAPRNAARILFLACVIAGPGAQRLAGQQQDTLPPPPDTAAAAQDTVLPPPLLLPWPGEDHSGWGRAAWVWNRDALAAEGALSLLEFLGSIPGITTFRAGAYQQPEMATAFGGGAGRIEVEIDGFLLDPLTGPALDLSTVELASLEHVRVERRLDRIRVILHTVAPEDARPFSRIEAGVGEPSANLFRGMLLVPRLVAGPFGFAVERIEGQEAGRRRPGDSFRTWVKWGVLRPDRGVQLEYRGNSFTRDGDSPAPLEGTRSDLVIRGRNLFSPGLVGEAWAGWSTESIDPMDPLIPDSLRTTREASSRQIGLRGAIERDRVGAEAALRFRNHESLPSWQADFSGRFSPIDRADLSVHATAADWRARRTTGYGGAASILALDGVRVFGEYDAGEAGSPVRPDTLRAAPVISDRTAWRAGVEAERFGIKAGAALLHVEMDSVATFGLPGDSVAHALPGGSVNGWEAWARLPIRGDWLSASLAYNTWSSGQRWAYLPTSALRASLDLHALPLESGNLEFIGRFEVMQRGLTAMPPLLAEEPLSTLASRNRVNAYLQIRIIEIRLFIRFDDIQGNFVTDLPGIDIRGPRLIYGVKWDFWN